MAGAEGVEPSVPVLETGGLPLTDAPVNHSVSPAARGDYSHPGGDGKSRQSSGGLRFLVRRAFAAILAELFHGNLILFLLAAHDMIILVLASFARKTQHCSFTGHLTPTL